MVSSPLKPEHYEQKYVTWMYGLNKLPSSMEKPVRSPTAMMAITIVLRKAEFPARQIPCGGVYVP